LRGELTPPFEIPIRKARIEVEAQIGLLERMPFANDEPWRILRERLVKFSETTKDLRTFSLEGYALFRDFEAQVNAIEGELAKEPGAVSQRSKELQAQSSKRILFWWLSALVIGLIVIAATVWEVQRRYRHEQESMEAAKRERQFSTQMLEGMVSAVAAIDGNAVIRSANSSFFELFPQASVGASVYDKLATPEARKMLEITVSQRDAPAGYRGRWVLRSGDETGARAITCDLYSSPLEMDGEHGQIVTLVDVSDAVESEAIMRRTEALAAVGQASAQVAHEIRNPLGSIRLGVSMLRDIVKGQEALRTIDLVERGIDHLNKLVVDVTQFSREKPLSRTEFDLHRLLDSSLELVAHRISEKNQHIEKRFSSTRITGEWDQDQLRQIFVNLLANAIDASKDNATVIVATELVTLNAPARSGASSGLAHQVARVTVKDQGDGIDETARGRIFEPFFTTKKRGTGLGLAIVKQIVERHGGTILVHSELGKGAEFVVDLPLSAPELVQVA
jgi:signal transduction histidine kinase